jgi:NDP-sugar pyrophosphorylase family protein
MAAAMVLAAGRGERMRPLSEYVPKPALPVLRQPLIASALRLAETVDAARVVVNTWHLADVMEAALSEIEFDTEIVTSREPELMDTAGGIALARERGLLGDRGPVLVVNGDGLLDLDLEPLIRRMATSDDLVSLALLPHLDPHRWSRVVLDCSGRVSGIRKPGTPERGEVPFLYPGVMLVAREALDALAVRPGAVPEDLWGPALAKQRLSGVLVSGHWREVGTPRDYLEAVLDSLNGSDPVVDPSARVDPSASIGPAFIGRGARIEKGAVVEDAVVAEGATVAPHARIVRSVLLGPVATRRGDVVTDEFRAPPRSRGHRDR